MPKVKLCREKPDTLAATVRDCVGSGTKLAQVVGCSIPTACRRLRDPSELTVADLRKLVNAGMDTEALASAVFGKSLVTKGG